MARVLVTGFCAVPGPTRPGVQLRHVVRALSARHTVDVLAVRDGDQAYVERQGGGRLLRVPTHDAEPAAQVLAFQRALRRQLEGADYDVVHCRDGWAARPVLEGRDRFGYAVVYDLTRGPMTERDDLSAELAEVHDREEQTLLAAADLVLVPTEPARRWAASRGHAERVLLAPPGVDVDRFDWDVVPPEGPPDGPPLVLYAGALAPGRGVRLLLRAMAEVVRTIAARALLIGPIAPGFDLDLRTAVRELGLAGRIEVRNPIDHELLPALIGRATVCVAPSATDLPRRPFALYPTKLLEFLACRRPVVAPRRSAVAALIDHGREGLLFEPDDPADLARRLVRVLEDRALRERLAATGYERVRREFTAAAARRAITTAYLRLAARGEWRARFLEATTGENAVTPPPAVIAVDDDELEATVFEATPPAAGAITGRLDLAVADDEPDHSSPSLETALAGLALDGDRSGPIELVDDGGGPDETAERTLGPTPAPTAPGRAAGDDGWVVRHVGRARRVDDDGTPVELLAPAAPPFSTGDFVAGEIEVPTPTPEIVDDDGAFTAASRLLGSDP